MWSPQKSKYLQPSAYSRRSTTFIDRDFQLKYTRLTLAIAVASSLLFLLPIFLFANQNYTIFYKLADLMNPALADYISRERIGLNISFVAAFVGNLVFWVIFSKKMTAKIAGPAKILRNHIRLLSRGDFSLPLVRIREDDEFKELINTYNYLYTLLKVQSERELSELKRVESAITNPIAKNLIESMIDERVQRLANRQSLPTPYSPISSTGAMPDASPDSRHAS
jgi:hypothetical protein